MNKTKKSVIIIGIIAVCTAIAVVLVSNYISADGSKELQYSDVVVSKVNMKQTLTSAGKITAGKSEAVALDKNRRVKGAAVEVNEQVVKGQALVYYTDGTHTDATADGIVTSIFVPKRGKKADVSHRVIFNRTSDMYMKITVPQEEINEIDEGSKTSVVVNALPKKSFHGTIIEKNDVPNSFFDKDQDSNTENEFDEEVGEDTSDNMMSDDDIDDELGEASSEDEEFEENSPRYTITIKFRNNGEVRPGMSARCVITISDRSEITAVPIQAVYFDENEKAYVNRVNGKKIEKVFVRTGQSDAMNVEIIQGLKPGEKVRIAVNSEVKNK